MRHHFAACTWWCRGFDGEGCPTAPDGISDEAAARLAAGESRWPGVSVLVAPGEG